MARLHTHTKKPRATTLLAAVSLIVAPPAFAEDSLEDRLLELARQNDSLLQLAQQQQAQIADLQRRLESRETAAQRQEQAIQELKDTAFDAPIPSNTRPDSRIIVSGEAGLAFFAGERNTEFPNEEFRIDDARLFLEAELAQNIYLVGGIELFRRESGDEAIEVGNLFVDFENVFGLEGDLDHLYNLRLGRFETPFGEEYLQRYVMENPLISHSVSDLWGIDEGIELYGDIDRFSYAVALQNGNTALLRDFDSDKSIAARLGYQATDHLHLSASWMRTGELDAALDQQSELWIGNVVFLSIGSPQTTKFHAELAQIDFSYSWRNGKLLGAYGQAEYGDNDPLGDNRRDFDFFHLEARHSLSEKLYLAARYSEMSIGGGFPISGNGARSIYLFGGLFTEQLERLSLGFGYWIGSDALMKMEYSFEDGDMVDGTSRQDNDQLAAELGVRF